MDSDLLKVSDSRNVSSPSTLRKQMNKPLTIMTRQIKIIKNNNDLESIVELSDEENNQTTRHIKVSRKTHTLDLAIQVEPKSKQALSADVRAIHSRKEAFSNKRQVKTRL